MGIARVGEMPQAEPHPCDERTQIRTYYFDKSGHNGDLISAPDLALAGQPMFAFGERVEVRERLLCWWIPLD